MPPLTRSLTLSPTALLSAIRRLSRPLVRLMISNGITFPVLAGMLRHLFVDVAANDILIHPKTQTDSRISLLTGIHRKEIRRLREQPPESVAIPEVVTVTSQIIARWLALPPFVDADGQPRPLPRTAEAAGGPSFEALVSSVTTDLRARTVLDDWLAQGLVRLASADRVVLNTNAYIPPAGGEEQLFYFARNLRDHFAAAAANISADTPAFLDRSVHYDRLTQGQARELEAIAREAAMRILLEVNRQALALVDANSTPDGDARHRVNFGVFVLSETEMPARNQPDHADGAAP